MAIEIVDFPINSMVIFYSYVSLPEGRPYCFPIKMATEMGGNTTMMPWSPPLPWRSERRPKPQSRPGGEPMSFWLENVGTTLVLYLLYGFVWKWGIPQL